MFRDVIRLSNFIEVFSADEDSPNDNVSSVYDLIILLLCKVRHYNRVVF